MMEATNGGSETEPSGVSSDPLEPVRIAGEQRDDAAKHPDRYMSNLPGNPVDQIASIASEAEKGGVTQERAEELSKELKEILSGLNRAVQEIYGIQKKLAPFRREGTEQSSEIQSGIAG